MLEKVIKLAGLTTPTKEQPFPVPDFSTTELVRVKTPSFLALETAAKLGVDMTDPDAVIAANFSIILAAFLTETSGLSASYFPVRTWHPREVASRMFLEELKNYDKLISELIKDLRDEIAARRGDSPKAAAATKTSKAGGAKPSASRSTRKTSKG